jgi:voltage-gated potassium channel
MTSGRPASGALSTLPRVEERVDRVAARFEIPMLVAALLVIPAIVIENSDAGSPWDGVATVLNWVIWTAFATEFAVLLYLAPDKNRWVRRHALDLLIVVGTPPFLPAALQSARLLRLLRLIRLLRLVRLTRELFSLDGLRYAALLALMTVLIGGVGFAAVEKPRQHLSPWDGIWWAVTTVTTVGYGDVQPESNAGRAIGIVVMVTGIGFVALLTAALAQRFLAREVAEDVAKIERPEQQALTLLTDISTRMAGLEQSVAALERKMSGAGSGDA